MGRARLPNGIPWSPPKQNKSKISKSKLKTMLFVSFDTKGVNHINFVPLGQTDNVSATWMFSKD